MLHAVYILVGLALILLGWRSLRESFRRGEVTLDFWFMVALVMLTNATTTVGTLTGSRSIGADAFFERTVDYVGPAGTVNAYATPLLVALSGVFLLIAAKRGRFSLVPFIFIAVLLVGAASASYRGPFMYGGRLALIVVLLVAAFLRPGRSAVAGTAAGLVFLAGLSGLAVAMQPAFALETCVRKCGVLGDLLVGVADNANSLGLLMALAVPVVYFGSARHAGPLSLLVAIVGLASGSRTASVAILVSLLVLVLCHLSKFAYRILPRISVSAGLLVMVLLPTLVTLPSAAFTGRSGLWQFALAAWRDSVWLGYGPDLWRTLVGNGPISRSAGYSTHNQFVEVLYVTGLLGTALLIMWVIAVMKSCNRSDVPVALMMLVPAVVIGITERPWSLGQIDGLSWSMILPMLVTGLIAQGSMDPKEPGDLPVRRTATLST